MTEIHVLLIAALAVLCAMGLAAMPAPAVAQRTYPVIVVEDRDASLD
jgi:hypothetical protein